MKCIIYYDTSSDHTPLVGKISIPLSGPTTYDEFGDCTQLGASYGTTNGISQYFSSSLSSGRISPLYIDFYYEDSEGYLIYNTSTLTATSPSPMQPSSINPITLSFYDFNG